MNRFNSSILILLVLSLTSFAFQVENSSQAVEIVKNELLQDCFEEKIVWYSKSVISEGFILKSFFDDIMIAPSDGWFVFIDDMPQANWNHPCRYVLVTSEGEMVIVDSDTPPHISFQLEFVNNEMYRKVCLAKNRRPTRTIFNPPMDPQTDERYAILVSGGIEPEMNFPRYWNDLANIYCTLVDIYLFEDDHIFVLCSDGLDPAPDQSNGFNSDPDLDGDNDDDITGPATIEELVSVTSWIKTNMDNDDLLIYFQTDHGGFTRTLNSFAYLWNGEVLMDTSLAIMVSSFQNSEQTYTFEQCASGGFLDDLIDSGILKRNANSACAADGVSMALPPMYEYDAYVFFWTAALRGETAYGTPVHADYNNDLNVSMREAFQFARTHDPCWEFPMYASYPEKFGDYETMKGLIEYWNAKLLDTIIDDDNIGMSSGNGDGIANPGEIVELYLTIRNTGTIALTPLNGILSSLNPEITILDEECSFPQVSLLHTTNSSHDALVVEISPNYPIGEDIDFNILVTDSILHTFSFDFSITCSGTEIYSEEISLTSEILQAGLSISPIPFNNQAVIDFSIPEAGYVELKLFDILGREISILTRQFYSSGSHTISFDGKDLESGVYFVSLNYADKRIVEKILMVK